MDIYWNTHLHAWTRTCTHARTHARTHSLTHSHTDLHTIAARTLEPGAACLQCASHTHTQPFTRLYKHTVQIDVRANAHTLPLELSLTHTHTRTPTHFAVIHYYMSILWTSLHWTSPYTFSSGRFFGRQTMRNDSKWKCTTCSPIRPLSSKPNICVFLSVCTRLVVKSSEKKAPAYENVWEWLKAPSLVYKATVTNRRSFYCIYMV